MSIQIDGKYIRDKRAALGMTQEALAERVGVSTKTITNWETEKVEIKSGNVDKLAEALGVSKVDLFAGEDTNLNDDTKREIDQRIGSLIERVDDVQTITIKVEDRGIVSMELGVYSFSFSIIAIASAWWAIFQHNLLNVIVCSILALFGIGFLFFGSRVIKKLEKRVQADREKKQQASS